MTLLRNRFGFIAGFAVLVLMSGCREPLPDPVDANDAGAHLRRALNAWKENKAYGSLANETPAIHFNESLWRDGSRLIDFEIGEVTLHGRQARCTATLKVEPKDGKQVERKIGYQIDTIPVIVIVREGLGP